MLRGGPLRDSFSHIVAAVYTAGTIFHVVRVIIRLDVTEMPFLPDLIIAVLGAWGAAGMIRFAGEVQFRGNWERLVHWLITFHLLVSVMLHVWVMVVQSHDALAVFSISYSYFGALYFGFFAWRSWTMRLRPAGGSKGAV